MSKFTTKDLIEFAGAVAVIASLLLVASELRQANNIALRDSRMQINQMQYDLGRLAFESESLVLLREKLRNPDTELNPAEQELALEWASMHMANWGNITASIDAGLLAESTANVWRDTAVSFVTDYPGIIPFLRDQVKARGLVRGYSPILDAVLDEIE